MSKENPVAVVACMDEHNKYDDGVVVFGTAGSLITSLGGGNQKVYPDSKRKLVAETRGAVFKGMKQVAEEMRMKLKITSHAGCGAGGAQEVNGKEALEAATKEMCESLELKYAGYIPHADEPVEIGEAGFKACITRSEAEHRHTAVGVVMTVGGGITQEEKERLEGERGGELFVVSADWIKYVLDNQLTAQQIVLWLQLHLSIADGIADGVRSGRNSVVVYDAGRLNSDWVKSNKQQVEAMLSSL